MSVVAAIIITLSVAILVTVIGIAVYYASTPTSTPIPTSTTTSTPSNQPINISGIWGSPDSDKRTYIYDDGSDLFYSGRKDIVFYQVTKRNMTEFRADVYNLSDGTYWGYVEYDNGSLKSYKTNGNLAGVSQKYTSFIYPAPVPSNMLQVTDIWCDTVNNECIPVYDDGSNTILFGNLSVSVISRNLTTIEAEGFINGIGSVNLTFTVNNLVYKVDEQMPLQVFKILLNLMGFLDYLQAIILLHHLLKLMGLLR